MIVGFGASSVDSISLPRVFRGFEVSKVNPIVGSVMGGNKLLIDGFGFLENEPSRHKVILKQINTISFYCHLDLVQKLNFLNNTKSTVRSLQ